MKLFFYKSILILFLYLVGFHYSFNYVIKTTKNKIENTLSKEKIELLEKKIKKEMQTAIDKSTFISKEDANLINKFLDKIKTDLNK